MAFYYFEKQDPNHPNQITRVYFADDHFDLEDIIYKMPGGIENYDKLMEVVEIISGPMRDAFLENKTIKLNNGFSLVPNLKESKYQDPELQKIEQRNTPIDITLMPDDPEAFLKNIEQKKVEGEYTPEPARIDKLIDFEKLPKFTELSEDNFKHYQKVEKEMASLKAIRRGMRVKILGAHLKIRPAATKDQGFFLETESGKLLDLTDFLEVNSTSVLLLSVPKDLPTGWYKIRIKSGWYADETIIRTGGSSPFQLV
ncbi:DUF4469 domain-containing protein [Thermophagus sp. OGC60D27]|uniref:DUF4469 domain-containing protein n=1 Tax=Thermophagus sp. OGC60D27 TaxID=3458415 RepID=UPI0040379A03